MSLLVRCRGEAPRSIFAESVCAYCNYPFLVILRFYYTLLTTTTSYKSITYVMRCAIWYHLYNSKNVKNTHGGVLILVKLQAEAQRITYTRFLFFMCVWNIPVCT